MERKTESVIAFEIQSQTMPSSLYCKRASERALHKLKFSARRKLLAFVSSFKFNYLAARCTRQTNVSMLQNFNLKHYMKKIMRMNRMKESQKWMKPHLIFSSFLHFVSIHCVFFWLSCLLVLNQIKKCKGKQKTLSRHTHTESTFCVYVWKRVKLLKSLGYIFSVMHGFLRLNFKKLKLKSVCRVSHRLPFHAIPFHSFKKITAVVCC